MKRIISVLLLTTNAFFSFSQKTSDSSKHLSFKGIPIDGTLAEYVSKMVKSGFTQKVTKDGVALLEGEFASYKNCSIGVITLKQKDLVSKIVVIFPNRDTWSALSGNYFNLKELLTEKYGNPSKSVEEFQSSMPSDDGSKFIEVKLDECRYYTTFETQKGTIQLLIQHDKMSNCYVELDYFDKINSDTIKKQALDDL